MSTSHLISCGADRRLCLWNLQLGTLVGTYTDSSGSEVRIIRIDPIIRLLTCPIYVMSELCPPGNNCLIMIIEAVILFNFFIPLDAFSFQSTF